MMQFRWSTLISTIFFIGFIPFAPGTFGSLAAFPIYFFTLQFTSSFLQASEYLLILAVILTLVGLWAIGKYQEITYNPDHPSVVIDEVIGMLVTLALAFEPAYQIGEALIVKGYFTEYSQTYHAFAIAFLAFRYFDISKPLLIGLVDRRLKTPFGVILDDILAGVFAGGTIIAAHKLMLMYLY